jgi:hypothetical protein
MKKHDTIKSVWIMTILALSTSVFAARRPAPVSLSPEGEKLEAHYSKMLEDLKKEIVSLAPRVDEKVKAEFTKQFSTLENIEPITKIVLNRPRTVRYGPAHPAYAEKQIKMLPAVRAVM